MNTVGVDLNTASAPLLARVAGVTAATGEEHRRIPRGGGRVSSRGGSC